MLIQLFFDGFTMAGIFGDLKRPGVPTQLCADEPIEAESTENPELGPDNEPEI